MTATFELWFVVYFVCGINIGETRTANRARSMLVPS